MYVHIDQPRHHRAVSDFDDLRRVRDFVLPLVAHCNDALPLYSYKPLLQRGAAVAVNNASLDYQHLLILRHFLDQAICFLILPSCITTLT